jgi:signal transduction histidine kinase
LISAGDVALAAQHLQELQGTAQEALREMRMLIFELRPCALDENGLATALRTRLETVEGRSGVETTLEVVGPERRLVPKVEEGLYRIAQEALNNALKHSQAQHIAVSLRHDQPVTVLEVVDDGVGFDPLLAREKGGLGLLGMEERARQMDFRLAVHSRPGAGTRVTVEVTT